MDANAGTVEDEVTSLTTNVIDVNDYDVLLGRGKLYEKHLGNVNLRELIVANMERYSKVRTPDEKFYISVEIVNSIYHSSRPVLETMQSMLGSS